MAQWTDGAYYPATVQKVDEAFAVHLLWQDGTPGIVSLGQIQGGFPEYWQTTGHSLFGMLIALVGGLLSRLTFTRPDGWKAATRT